MGETIASSAGTVIVGLAMMVFAELGLYNTTGPAIAIGVAITLVAGLTLIPALLAVLGHHAFWPRKAAHVRDQGLWAALGRQGSQAPRDRVGGTCGGACAPGLVRQRPSPRF